MVGMPPGEYRLLSSVEHKIDLYPGDAVALYLKGKEVTRVTVDCNVFMTIAEIYGFFVDGKCAGYLGMVR